jgi:hypothetical protein
VPTASYACKDLRVRCALLQAAQAAKLDETWKAAGGGKRGRANGTSISTAGGPHLIVGLNEKHFQSLFLREQSQHVSGAVEAVSAVGAYYAIRNA